MTVPALGDHTLAEPFLTLAADYAEAVLPYLDRNQALPFYSFVQSTLSIYAVAVNSTSSLQRTVGPGAGGTMCAL